MQMPAKSNLANERTVPSSASPRMSTVGGHHAQQQLPQEAIPFVDTVPVEIEKNDTTRTEMVKTIIAWLVGQGFASSAQVLREEATAQLREEHNQRKSLRAICRCLEDHDWDGTQKHLRKLQNRVPNTRPPSSLQTDDVTPLTTLTRSLPFLLAQQQFLELVDEDDSQRAFAFFVRSIKPLEPSLSREHFQKLNYLLTCKTVSDGAPMYPEYRGWTPEIGRAQLIEHISKVLGNCLTEPYCRQGNITSFGVEDATLDDASNEQNEKRAKHPGEAEAPLMLKSLDTMAAQALAYEMLLNEHPQLNRGRRTVTVRSLLLPLHRQLPPAEPLLYIDVNQMAAELLATLTPAGGPSPYAQHLQQPLHVASQVGGAVPACIGGSQRSGGRAPHKLTACQPFLCVPAIAVGTQDGLVLWIPLVEPTNASGPATTSLFSAARRAQGPRSALGAPVTTPALAPTAGDGAALVHVHKYAIKGMERHRARLLVWGGPQLVVLDLSARAQPEGCTSQSVAPCGSHDAGRTAPPPGWCLARSDGPAAASAGANCDVTHIFTHGADVTSSCFFPCGSIIIAGLSDGTVTVWDAVSGAKMFDNTFSKSPVVSVLVNHTGTAYYAGTKEGTICVVDVATGMMLNMLAAPTAGELSALTLAPSSMLLLASHRGGALRLWDVLMGKQLPYHFLGAEKSTRSSFPVTFGCQDSQIIAGSSDGCLYFWDLSGFVARPSPTAADRVPPDSVSLPQQRCCQNSLVRPFSQLPLHRGSIADVKMDATYLVSCAADGIVYVCSNGSR